MRVPLTTYRLQLNAGFPFESVRGLVGYLDDLGVTDVYLSPVVAARRGSSHGYDVTDPSRINPELGGVKDFAAMARALRRRGMAVLIDVVPNHMAARCENPWWADVLEKGRRSGRARFFDIDWDRHGGDARGQITLPVLGDELERVLARGELRFERDSRGAWIRYHDRLFPVDPRTLRGGAREAPPGPSRIRSLLARQCYRLVWWRRAADEINYRRFFDINDLVCLKMEDSRVFEARHALLLRLARSGWIDGIRVDHVDGLADPVSYLRRLKWRLGGGVYLVVEKILVGAEELPASWPVAGTTGYDFLQKCGEIFVGPDGARRLRRALKAATGAATDFETIAREARLKIIRTHFRGEMRDLARRIAAAEPGADEVESALTVLTACLPLYRTYAGPHGPGSRDAAIIRGAMAKARRIAPGAGAHAWRLVADALLPPGAAAPNERRRRDVMRRWQQLTGPIMAKGVEDTALYLYPALVSLNEVGGRPDSAGTPPSAFHRWMKRRSEAWPHTMNATATHDTKRGEDVRARISVLSEIPEEWEARLGRWRRWNRGHRAIHRGGPVPGPVEEILIYQTLLGAWPVDGSGAHRFRERLRGYIVKAAREAKSRTSWVDPDPAYEKILVGFCDAITGPPGGRFMEDFLALHARIGPPGAVNGLAQLVVKALAPGVADFYQGTELWDQRLVDPDNRRPVDYRLRSRMLEALRLDAGRDPVRLARRLLARWQDGRIKLLVTWRCLSLRRSRAALFRDGLYLPIAVDGRRREKVLAFARRRGSDWAVAVVPRLTAAIVAPGTFPVGPGVWGGSAVRLPRGAPLFWKNVLTGEILEAATSGGTGRLALSAAFGTLPAAVLVPDDPPGRE